MFYVAKIEIEWPLLCLSTFPYKIMYCEFLMIVNVFEETNFKYDIKCKC